MTDIFIRSDEEALAQLDDLRSRLHALGQLADESPTWLEHIRQLIEERRAAFAEKALLLPGLREFPELAGESASLKQVAAGLGNRERRENDDAADVARLHGTPVTLGVVLAINGLIVAMVLALASFLWSGTTDIRKDITGLRTEVNGLRVDIATLTGALQTLTVKLEERDKQLQAMSAKLDKLGQR
jgi:phage shock protein A